MVLGCGAILRPMRSMESIPTLRAVPVAEPDPAGLGRGWPHREPVLGDRPFKWGNVCAVNQDRSLLAWSLGRGVRLFDPTGSQVARFQLESPGLVDGNANCVFARDGRHLWAHAAIDHHDELWLVDLATLQVVDHRRLDTPAGSVQVFDHPDRQTLGFHLWDGQGNSATFWVRPAGGRIQLRRAPDTDRVLVDLHPSGREYLTTSGDGVELWRHRFDDDHVVDQLPAAAALPTPDLFGEQDLWYYCAGYLTDEVILASVQNQNDGSLWHALVRRSPMSLLGRVDYGLGMLAPGEFERPSGGSWTTSGDAGRQRWRLAEDPSERLGTRLSLLEPPGQTY
jgi:hypothetical protein